MKSGCGTATSKVEDAANGMDMICWYASGMEEGDDRFQRRRDRSVRDRESGRDVVVVLFEPPPPTLVSSIDMLVPFELAMVLSQPVA